MTIKEVEFVEKYERSIELYQFLSSMPSLSVAGKEMQAGLFQYLIKDMDMYFILRQKSIDQSEISEMHPDVKADLLSWAIEIINNLRSKQLLINGDHIEEIDSFLTRVEEGKE